MANPKRIHLIVFFLVCFGMAWSHSVFSQGQNPPASNLENLLRTSQRQLNNERYELAYQSASQALTLSRQQGDKVREARAINLIAIAAFHTNRIGEAIRYLKQVSIKAEDAGFARIQSAALIRAGALLRLTGRYEDALYCFQNGLRIARQHQLKNPEALALSQLGAMYADTADFNKAELLLNEALPIARELPNPETHALLLMRLSYVAKGRGDLAAALKYCEQAEALLAGQPRKLRHIEIVYQLATVHVALNQWPKAKTRFELGLQLCRDLRAPQFAAILLGNYADLLLKLGEAAAAADKAAQAITTLRRGGGSQHREAQYLATQAEALRALGRNDEALASYRQALTAMERARALAIPTETSRAGIVATRHQVFAGAIAMLLKSGQAEEAFDVAESYHARAFLDVLAESALDQADELTPAQQAQEEKLIERLSSVQRELLQPEVSSEREPQLQRDLTEAETALELFRLEQRRADPRYASLKAPQPLTHERIAKDLLNRDTALIEYALGEKQSFVWVIANGKVGSAELPASRELASDVAAYQKLLTTKVAGNVAASELAKLKVQSQRLYQKLIHPLEQHLAQSKKLIIVTDGALAYLPFETLAAPAKRGTTGTPFLFERYAISYAPSASALLALREFKRDTAANAKGIIAFGDPVYAAAAKDESAAPERGFDFRQLPYTRREVNEIAALFPVEERRVFLGAEANEQNLKAAALSANRYLHFATHALIDEARPARSGIMLSTQSQPDSKEDGALQMHEIIKLSLNADLVTLSACRTGLGQLVNGEGMIGLTRSFLYAGAESVVVSLWNVNDIATASLMKTFYKNLQQGMNKDEALRQAKLALLKGQQPAWRHPYYWAAFVLAGDAR